MNILNYDIKNTKLFKKIMISICSMIMVFASCFAPYSKVKALVGIDDVALSYVALSVLGLCGITLAGTTLSNTDITKLGSDVAGSISRTFDTLGKTVSDKWNLLVQTAGATGKIALDYVNDLKINIQDWWNSLTTIDKDFQSIVVAMGGQSVVFNDNFNLSSNLKPFVDKWGNNESFIWFGNDYVLSGRNSSDMILGYDGSNYFISSFDLSAYNELSNIYHNVNPNISKEEVLHYYTNYIYGAFYKTDTNSSNYVTYGNGFNDKEPFYITVDMLNHINLNSRVGYPKLLFINTQSLYLGSLSRGKYDTLFPGFELDNVDNSNIPGAFKLDDRVLGSDGVLSLSDKIIGAVGSLDLDLTNNVVNSYGYVDVPSTTLDYPYTGTWDSTLDGIGAIAWAPSTDVPIADTNVIAPSIPGTIDIPKVKDFTREGSQLSFDWKGVFPFCIPFDLIAFLKCLCAEPEAPKFDIPVNIPKIYEGNIKVDLSDFDDVAALCRTLFDILFILGLAYATRYLIKG